MAPTPFQDYAAAWNGLASNYSNQGVLGLLPMDEGNAKSREAAEQALAIDPDYAPAHAVLGGIAMWFDHDLAQAARHIERALQLDPTNSDIISYASTLLQSLGRVDEAVTLDEYVIALDPVSPESHNNLGYSYGYASRWDDAIASLQTAQRLSPGRIGAYYVIGTFLLFKGEPEAALAAMQQESLEAYRLLGLVISHYALGDQTASAAVLNELIGKYGREWTYSIAYVFAYRGEADRAFEWLDKAMEYDNPGLTNIVVQPEFGNIQSDPRWLPFLESIGKSPAQLDAIEFKVTLPR